ncbi:hypothetical protein SEA_SHAWTY_41 [Streptomyces phage Shawty]|uniref:Uncharacterized protein n=1 Tax=Streptomyces phage Shawty TaxID=2510521 RepID=A0A411CYU6_9CAUD|nr:hypothetical protein SEA_SHAWTY_41 [Streptomyces phage Shawty]
MSAHKFVVRPGITEGHDVIRVNQAGQGWALTTYRNKAVAEHVARMLADADRLDEKVTE